MGHRLWYGTFDGVLNNYYSSDCPMYGQFDMFEGENLVRVIPLYVDGNAEFPIEDVDYITAGFKNESNFISGLDFESDDFSFLGNHILMTHIYNGLKEDSIVYDCPLLRKCAFEVKSKKKIGYTDNEIWLTKNDDLLNFIKRLTGYIINERSAHEILKLSLSPNLMLGISRYRDDYNKHISKREKRNFNIIYSECLKYSNLRKLIVWEQKHLANQKEKRVLSSKKGIETKNLKNETLMSLGRYEKNKREALTTDFVTNIYETRDKDGNIDWDRVWSENSADDVYKPSNFDDLHRIGFFDVDETVSPSGFSVNDGTGNTLVKKK